MIKLNSKNILNIFLPIGMILVMLYGGISLSVERYGKKNEHMSFHCFTQKDSLYLTAIYGPETHNLSMWIRNSTE